MRPLVPKRIQGRKPDELIFYPPNHKTYHRAYFVVQLARLCRLARSTGGCVRTAYEECTRHWRWKGGATSDAVAKALGHGSFEMTKTHYASASSVTNNESPRRGCLAGQSPRSELDGLLNQLSPIELESLLIKLQSGGRSGSGFEGEQSHSVFPALPRSDQEHSFLDDF